MFSIVEAIRQRATPEAVALVQKDRTLSFQALFQQCDSIAAMIRQHLPQDPARADRLRIGVHFPSSLDYVPLALGTLAAWPPAPAGAAGWPGQARPRHNFVRTTRRSCRP